MQNGGGEHGNQGGRLSGGFEEDGDGTSRLVTEGSGEDATYKPSAHGGKKEDGTDDKRECYHDLTTKVNLVLTVRHELGARLWR